MENQSIVPVTLYGSSISYFTGKLENYFRIRGIPYQFKAMDLPSIGPMIQEKTGSTQMPALELADGRWMSDTTAIIQWLEAQYDSPTVTPSEAQQRFFSLLLEDYADEWLWRPAMHFRWYYAEGARWASTHLADEVAAGIPIPNLIKRRMIIRRQRVGFTAGDGISRDQVEGVEAIYHRTLAQLQAILCQRPFLLGDRPSLVDIGFSGPMFRHFGLDPIPAEIMRQQAPAVWEWSARLWNSPLKECHGELLSGVPQDWGPILDEIGSNYLPYLCANVDAVSSGLKRFDAEIGGVAYRGARCSRYRVWCLRQLREQFAELNPADKTSAQALLERHGCWEPLWRQAQLPLDDSLCDELPFRANARMLDVYED